jgi:hypothetical protein
MDQFTDIQIVEANRLHSEEAKAGNNENTSLWTNNLQDILMLNPKDQVSVHGAFISERGVGQSTSIEIKGEELGEEHLFTYTNLERKFATGDRINNNLPSRASIIEGFNVTEKLKIKDNQLKFVINYFIPANAQNCLHLPRRFMWNYPQERVNFTQVDDRSIQGATRTYYDRSNYSLTHKLYQSPAFYNTITTSGEGGKLLKPVNDNSRYTLMIREKTFFTSNSLGIGGEDDLPVDDMRDPENAIYRTYRELKEIEIPSGFNSPEFIATEITRQLQNIINDQVLVQDNSGSDPYPQPFAKIVESETYKAFYSGNIHDNTQNNFLYYFNLDGTGNTANEKLYRAGHTNASGFEWLRQYGIIACKYPEIYEKGRLINIDAISGENSGIRGSEILFSVDLSTATKDTPIIIALEYNASNCQLFKEFFDAQKLYPEIITNLNDPNSGYNEGNTINNTRWIHINRWDTSKQSLANPPTFEKTQLGYGGYYEPRSYVPSGTTQLQSLLLPLYFDPEQENVFYENPELGKNQFSFGCLGKSGKIDGKYYIEIYPFKHETNGLGSPPFEELKDTGVFAPEIPGGRRIGFDLHFNAPGMYYLLPLSGYTTHPTPTSSYSTELAIYNVNANNTNVTLTAPEYLGNPYQKLLYIGSDNPQLNWDGTNFNFSYFHTTMNRGNQANAGLPTALNVATDDFASDEVYKINPIELLNDWTPDRCPYAFNYTIQPLAIFGGSNFSLPRPNTNYNPYQIFDQLCGIMIEDFGVGEDLWTRSLWGLLGFSYRQFHGTNNRLVRIQRGNANNLSLITTNAEVVEGDTKIYSTNWASIPMYNNMIQTPFTIKGYNASGNTLKDYNKVIPNIIHKTTSMTIIADNLPTRMIRGYYTIRSNILEGTPYIGGKVNNTTMPIIGVVNKINNYGDFTFGEESSLQFTITKPIRLASLSVSVHDPDGSYARTSEQSTILFKIQRPVVTTFNVAQAILEEQQQQGKNKGTNQ